MLTDRIFPALIILTVNQLALCLAQSQISVPPYSAEEDRLILDLFEGLRVADVSDAQSRYFVGRSAAEVV